MGWFRAHDGISTDVKYPAIAERCGQPVERVIAVWLHVLDEANKAEVRGEVHIDSETYASFLRCRPEDIEAILAVMQRPKRDRSPGMITDNRVSAWTRRNPLREDEGAAERKRRQREREREGPTPCDPGVDDEGHALSRTVTHCHTLSRQTDRQDRKKERKKEDDAPGGANTPAGVHHWRGKVIRLTQVDFDRWAEVFHAVDLPAQLLTIDEWLASDQASPGERKRWFHIVPNILRKRHEEALARKREANGGAGLKVAEGYGFGLV